MKLRLSHIVRREEKSQPRDRRRRVNWVLVSYVGEDGEEYRKSFASYGEPVIPNSGTHEELNAIREQW